MTLADTRAELDALWEDWERRGEDLKDPYYSVERLEGVYRAASGERRAEMEQVFCEWVSSDDGGLRMAARGLLLDHSIQQGVEALRARGEALAGAEEVWYRFERQQVLDFATEIEDANGVHQKLAANPAELAQAVRNTHDRLDAEAHLPDGRSQTDASVSELQEAGRLLTEWQHDRDPAHLAALAEMVTESWAPDYSLSKLILAICAAARKHRANAPPAALPADRSTSHERRGADELL